MDGTSSQKVTLKAAECAPQASLNKLTASGVSPLQQLALGPLLHARKAGLTSVGCSSRARELARLSTNWIASELHLPPVSRASTTRRLQSLCVFCVLVRTGPFANTAGSWLGLSVARQDAPQGGVHRHWSSVKQQEPGCEDLDAPFVFGPHRHVHIPEQTVESHVGSSFTQDSVIVLSGQAVLCRPFAIHPTRIRTCFLSQPKATSSFLGSSHRAASTVNSGLLGHPWSTPE